jgi:hypothetical protein
MHSLSRRHTRSQPKTIAHAQKRQSACGRPGSGTPPIKPRRVGARRALTYGAQPPCVRNSSTPDRQRRAGPPWPGIAGPPARREWFPARPGPGPERSGKFCREADRVVVVRPTSSVSRPPERKRCPASVGSAGAGGSVPVTAAVAGTGRPTLVRWRWTVTTAFGLGGITVSAWGPRLPAIKAALGTGTATIGLLLAGVTVGAILGLLASTPVCTGWAAAGPWRGRCCSSPPR